MLNIFYVFIYPRIYNEHNKNKNTHFIHTNLQYFINSIFLYNMIYMYKK